MQLVTITSKVITITIAITFVLKYPQKENKSICMVERCFRLGFNTFAAGLWIYLIWKSGKNEGYFS